MTVSRTIETDPELADLSAAVQTEVMDKIIDATVRADADPKAPCRVTVEVDAEVVAEPPEGASDEVRA